MGVTRSSSVARLGVVLCFAAWIAGCEAAGEPPPELGVASAGLLLAASCPPGTNVIQGTSTANTINGTAGNDCILGHGGNDTIYGLGGDDFLIGGVGTDTIYGGDGADTLYGEDNGDRLEGEAGADTIYGGGGLDIIFGGDGNDLAYGEDSADTIEGGLGDDVLYGDVGGDIIRGGGGADRIFGGTEVDELYGDDGDDIIDGGSAGDRIEGGAGHDVLQGGPQNDVIFGNDGNDAILGGKHVNTIDGGSGTDRCIGTACELAAPVEMGCTLSSQCPASQTCYVDVGGVCLPCLSDIDGDNTCDASDGCPSDPLKVSAGVCGCGVVEADGDEDGVCDASDVCPGSDDAIDTDEDGIPDGCDGCASDAECEDGNECTVATCTDRVCSYPAVPRGSGVAAVVNGDFELARFDDFTPYQTAMGTMVPSFLDARLGGSSAPFSQVAALRVGRASGVFSGSEGGGLRQIVNLNDGPLTVSAKIGTHTTSSAPSFTDGGIYTLLVDGVAVATRSFGPVSPGFTISATLNGTVPWIVRGPHELRIEVTRAAPPALTVTSYIDDIVLGGLATQQPVACGDGAGVCVDAGTCEPCSDTDADGTCDDLDGCASDPGKPAAGECGCGYADTDSDADGTADCIDLCPNDPNKVEPSICGCGISDIDTDQDFVVDCFDGCPNDPTMTWDNDADGDGALDCTDQCASDPNKIAAGVCGCTFIETDPDGDGNITCVHDACLFDPTKIQPGICGCDVPDVDSDTDGVADCVDSCQGSDDSLDEDEDGVPDGCDNGCVAEAVGPFIHEGDAIIESAADVTALEGMSCITGRLYITNTSLHNLHGLEALEAVVGQVEILDNAELTSLSGLDRLWRAGSLRILDNPNLTHVDELASLTSLVDALWISGNGSLSNLAGLMSLEPFASSSELVIADNVQLPPCWRWLFEELLGTECGVLDDPQYPVLCTGNLGSGSCGELPPDFACVPGATGPGVYDGNVYISGSNATEQLADFAGVRCITGDLSISDTSLASLDPLASLRSIHGGLAISSNENLTDIVLPALTTIGGSLSVSGNDQLVSLAGLASLESVNSGLDEGALFISYNGQLPPCWAWLLASQAGVSCYDEWSCDGNLGSGSCGELPPDFVCEPGATGPGVYDGDVMIYQAESLNQLAEMAGVRCVTGDLLIESPDVTDLDELAALRAVGGDLTIQFNHQLTDLGLSALTRVGGSLTIQQNASLTSLAGLSSLTSVNEGDLPYGGFVIGFNPSLPPCWVWLLEAQTSERCGGVGPWEIVRCYGNEGESSCGELPPDFVCEPGAVGPNVYDRDAVISGAESGSVLASLAGVQCITGTLSIDSADLAALDALHSLRMIGGDLDVRRNSQLTDVDLPALTTVNGSIRIQENDVLASLAGLSSLALVNTGDPAGAIAIDDNDVLPPCWVWMIEGQIGIECGYSEHDAERHCSSNGGTGSCGELPPDFVCERSAKGPGVYHGTAFVYGADAGTVLESLRGARCITGDLMIMSTILSDLAALSSLQAIGNDLWLITNENLTDIDLPMLTSVGRVLGVDSNPALTSLAGLASLESIGSGRPADGLVVGNNAQLPECWVDAMEIQTDTTCGQRFGVLDFHSCQHNDGTGTCTGAVGAIDCGPGSSGPGVFQGSVLASGAGAESALAALEGIECITGTLAITDSALSNLSQLQSLVAIAGDLEVSNNDLLATAEGLDNLRHLGGALIVDVNAALPACWVDELEARTDRDCGSPLGGPWQECEGNNGVGSCQPPLPTYCQPGASGPGIFDGDVYIWEDEANVAAEDLAGIHCITGHVLIADSSLTNLDMFESVAAIGESLYIANNPQLTEVDGLGELESIGGGLQIEHNDALEHLAGLTRLRWNGASYPDYRFRIVDNDALPDCWAALLAMQLWLTPPSGDTSSCY